MKLKYLGWALPVLVGLVAWGAIAHLGGGSRALALAELQVENLTCGSCIKKIRKALGEVKGTENVEVDLTSGRVKAEFEPEKTDPDTLARALSEAGYPAVVKQVFSPADYLDLHRETGRLAATHVGRIGDRLISVEDFERELGRMRDLSATASGGDENGLRREVWLMIQQRETLLGEAERLKVLVQDGEVDARMNEMRQGMPEFDALVAERFGGEQDFLRQLKEELTIRRLLDEQEPSGKGDEGLRHARLNEWYRQLVARTTVEVFDPALRSALLSGGGSCCP